MEILLRLRNRGFELQLRRLGPTEGPNIMRQRCLVVFDGDTPNGAATSRPRSRHIFLVVAKFGVVVLSITLLVARHHVDRSFLVQLIVSQHVIVSFRRILPLLYYAPSESRYIVESR